MVKICTIRKPFKVRTIVLQLHLMNRQRSYEAIKITHTFMMGMWFDHSCFEYTYGQPYMAALQHNVQTYTYFY